MSLKIALITPKQKSDHLTRTLVDGLEILSQQGKLTFKTSEQEGDFVSYAKQADLIILCWGKESTQYELAEKINCFDKTVFTDGSEVGKNRRYDAEIQYKQISGTYEAGGKIDWEMFKKCKKYFRREKPYLENIIPLPFGIESQSICYREETKKDIDIFCVFGQDEYPLLRRYATKLVQDFSKSFLLVAITESLSPDEFHRALARSKFAISIGGGGFDTGRFWEGIGNNCIIITETIDIFKPEDRKLDYKRIWQFNNLYDLENLLKKAERMIKDGSYDTLIASPEFKREYADILEQHSSVARVQALIKESGFSL